MKGKETKFAYGEYLKCGDNMVRVVGFINDDYVLDIFYDDMRHSFRENQSMRYIDEYYEHYGR